MAVKSKWSASPRTSQTQAALYDPSYLSNLKTINDRIMSEINRIDDELEHIKDDEEEHVGNESIVSGQFNIETQKLIDGLDFPSSPVISPTTKSADSDSKHDIYQPDFTLVITSTLLDVEEKLRVKRWAEGFGAIYMSQFNEGVTHVIAKTSKPNLAVRSMKTMQAIVHGSWLLSLDWIDTCMQSEGILREDGFELEGDQYSEDEGPRRSRLSHLNKESKLFDGYKFYLHGTFGTPSRDDLAELIVSAGGTVIETIDQLAKNQHAIVIGDPNEQWDLEKDQGVVEKCVFVQTEWVFCSISSYEILDTRHFRFL